MFPQAPMGALQWLPVPPLFAPQWPAGGCSMTWATSESTTVHEPRVSCSGGKSRSAKVSRGSQPKAAVQVLAPAPNTEAWLRNLITTSQAGWCVPLRAR